MTLKKVVVAGSIAVLLAGCGGAGNVSGASANRGSSVERADAAWQVQTMARATAFDSESDISTRGQAEVIYRAGGWGVRTDRANLVSDALARARAVSGCTSATHSHSQDSLQGIHVMVLLSECPPLSRG